MKKLFQYEKRWAIISVIEVLTALVIIVRVKHGTPAVCKNKIKSRVNM